MEGIAAPSASWTQINACVGVNEERTTKQLQLLGFWNFLMFSVAVPASLAAM